MRIFQGHFPDFFCSAHGPMPFCAGLVGRDAHPEAKSCSRIANSSGGGSATVPQKIMHRTTENHISSGSHSSTSSHSFTEILSSPMGNNIQRASFPRRLWSATMKSVEKSRSLGISVFTGNQTHRESSPTGCKSSAAFGVVLITVPQIIKFQEVARSLECRRSCESVCWRKRD